MKHKLMLALAGLALAAGLDLPQAQAFAPMKADALQAERLVQEVHFKHRSCELGPYGWHRHVGPAGWRKPCWPRARYPHRCWVDRYGARHCWW